MNLENGKGHEFPKVVIVTRLLRRHAPAGKPLVMLAGKPDFSASITSKMSERASRVIVATEDDRS